MCIRDRSIILFCRAIFFLSILESSILQYREPPKSVPPYFAVPGTAAVPPKNEVPGTAKKYRQVEILHRMCPPEKNGTEEDPEYFGSRSLLLLLSNYKYVRFDSEFFFNLAGVDHLL